METQERRAKVESFETGLMNLLIEHRDIFGPAVDPTTDRLCDHPEDPCPCAVSEGYTPTNFIVVTNWTDFNMTETAGEDWMDVTATTGMRRSQIIGLLTMATDGARMIVACGR